MKMHLAVWGLVLALAACGCERKSADEAESFDPKLDSVSAVGENRLDPGLLADQGQIAQAAAKRRGAVASAGDPIEAAKQVLSQMLEAAKAQERERMIEFFTPEDAALMKPLVGVQKEIEEKAASLSQLVKERLGVDMQGLGPQLAGGPSGIAVPAPGELGESSIDKVKFEQTETGVEATFAEGLKYTFVQVDGAWKIKLGLDPSAAPVFSEFAEAIKGFLDDVRGGVEDGSITKKNFQARMQELMQAKLGPVMVKLGQVMAKTMPAVKGRAGPAGPGEAAVGISADFPLEGSQPADQILASDVRRFIDELAGLVEQKQFSEAAAMYVKEDAPLVRAAMSGNWRPKRVQQAIDAASAKAGEMNIDFNAAGKAFLGAYDEAAVRGISATLRRSLAELQPFTANDATIVTANDMVLVSTPAGGRLLLVQVDEQWKRRVLTGERKALSALREFNVLVDRCWEGLIEAMNVGSIASQTDLDAKAAELATNLIVPAFQALERAGAGMLIAPVPPAEGSVAPAVRPGRPRPLPVQGEPGAAQPKPEAMPVEPNAPARVEPNAAIGPEQQYQQDRGPEKAQETRQRLLRPTKRLTGGGS
jgi:hypothetical protein